MHRYIQMDAFIVGSLRFTSLHFASAWFASYCTHGNELLIKWKCLVHSQLHSFLNDEKEVLAYKLP